MPYFQKGETSIYYEIHGAGPPLLLLPPGGMNATIDFWGRTPFNAVQIFSEDFRVIALDQRNAGRSSGSIDAGDPWDAYLADHVGLLNHLGIERCHLLGCCIGAAYALKLLQAAPHRIGAAVLQQPVGLSDENRELWPAMFDDWARDLLEKRPDLDADTVARFGREMWGGDFALSVSREDVAAIANPVLVLPGIDVHHPNAVGHEIAALIPHSEIIEPWREPANLVPAAVRSIRDFFRRNPLPLAN
jgi:pimeloyl-ACP methyl ester carboxylesterase